MRNLIEEKYEVDAVLYNLYDDKTAIITGIISKSLSSITIPLDILKADVRYVVIGIGEKAFEYCKKLKSVIISGMITNIAESAFLGCTRLESIIIPSSVTYIGARAFCKCFSLRSIVLPDSVTYIGRKAFRYCVNLRNIVIPSALTDINKGTFEFCTNLNEIICNAPIPPKAYQDLFDTNFNSDCILYVPDTSIDQYKNSEYMWNCFKTILPLSMYSNTLEHVDTSSNTIDGTDVFSFLLSLNPGVYTIKKENRERKIIIEDNRNYD
jgi:hypothetical protein